MRREHAPRSDVADPDPASAAGTVPVFGGGNPRIQNHSHALFLMRKCPCLTHSFERATFGFRAEKQLRVLGETLFIHHQAKRHQPAVELFFFAGSNGMDPDVGAAAALAQTLKLALSQNAPCGVSTRQKNPHLRSVNAGFSSARSLPDIFCDSAKLGWGASAWIMRLQKTN